MAADAAGRPVRANAERAARTRPFRLHSGSWTDLSPFREDPFYGLLIAATLCLAAAGYVIRQSVSPVPPVPPGAHGLAPAVRRALAAHPFDLMGRTLVAVVVFGASAVLYWVRRAERAAYGILEVVVALLYGFKDGADFLAQFVSAAGAPRGVSLHDSLPLLAALYIGVRGLDNMEQGKRDARDRRLKREEDRAAALARAAELAATAHIPLRAAYAAITSPPVARARPRARSRAEAAQRDERVPVVACTLAGVLLVQALGASAAGCALAYCAGGVAVQDGPVRGRLASAVALALLLFLVGAGLGLVLR